MSDEDHNTVAVARLEARIKALEDLCTVRFASQESAVTTAMASAEKAVVKAEMASEKRFESVNEFRNTLADQQRSLMPRTEAEALFKNLAEKIESLSVTVTAIAPRREGSREGWGYAVGVVGLVLAALGIIAAFRQH